jgi:hypothetical protein
MRDGRGTHFDGELLDLFLASVPTERNQTSTTTGSTIGRRRRRS